MDTALRANFPFFMKYYTFETPFIRPSPLAVARYKHLDGDFAGDGEQPGALGVYLNSRTSNEIIARFEETEEGQNLLKTRMMGDRELTAADKQQMIAAQKQALTISKVHASYFMGLAQCRSRRVCRRGGMVSQSHAGGDARWSLDARREI